MNWMRILILLRLRKAPLVSILVPFTSQDPYRVEAFAWLREYWRNELPSAEFIVGESKSVPFCKTEALNNAAKRANGLTYAVLDADAYLDVEVLTGCAEDILKQLEHGHKLWYVPYRRLLRLDEDITRRILQSDPRNPFMPSGEEIAEHLDTDPADSKYGRSYAAMAYVIPKEALKAIMCFDERFDKGWGGEDISTLRALDCLWGKHKTSRNAILHIWHPKISASTRARSWNGQRGSNAQLAIRYRRASNSPSVMRALVAEGCEYATEKRKYNSRWSRFKRKVRSLLGLL